MTRSAYMQVRCAVVALWSERHQRYAARTGPETSNLTQNSGFADPRPGHDRSRRGGTLIAVRQSLGCHEGIGGESSHIPSACTFRARGHHIAAAGIEVAEPPVGRPVAGQDFDQSRILPLASLVRPRLGFSDGCVALISSWHRGVDSSIHRSLSEPPGRRQSADYPLLAVAGHGPDGRR